MNPANMPPDCDACRGILTPHTCSDDYEGYLEVSSSCAKEEHDDCEDCSCDCHDDDRLERSGRDAALQEEVKQSHLCTQGYLDTLIKGEVKTMPTKNNVSLHICNGGVTFSVEDTEFGPQITIESSNFGNNMITQNILTDRHSLLDLANMFLKAHQTVSDTEYVHKASSK